MEFGVVCIGNYCRSPVAEALLKDLLKLNSIDSVGINPKISADMHPFSREYLEIIGLNPGIHTPKKISYDFVYNTNTIFCLDEKILLKVSKLYPKFSYKLELLNFHSPKIKIPDPFKLENKMEYFKIMDRLRQCCQSILNFYNHEI